MNETFGRYKISTIITGNITISYYNETQRLFLFRNFIRLMKKAEYVYLHCNNLDRIKEVKDELLSNQYNLRMYFVRASKFLETRIYELRRERRLNRRCYDTLFGNFIDMMPPSLILVLGREYGIYGVAKEDVIDTLKQKKVELDLNLIVNLIKHIKYPKKYIKLLGANVKRNASNDSIRQGLIHRLKEIDYMSKNTSIIACSKNIRSLPDEIKLLIKEFIV